MKALLKSVTAFKCESPIEIEALAKALESSPFTERLPTQRHSLGFKPFESGEFVYSQMGAHLWQLKIQSAMLPATIIRKELDKQVAEIQANENRKLSKDEKTELQESIEFEMVQRAFNKDTVINAYFHGDMLYVGATGSNVEVVTGELRKALGSLKIEPITFNCAVVTEWLNGVAPNPFDFTGNMALVGSTEDTKKEKATFNRMDVDADEIGAALESGKVVNKAELNMLDGNDEVSLSFTISEGAISGLSFANLIEDEANSKDKAELFDSRVALTVASIKDVFDNLKSNGAINE
jgi:recombination associated protein RdgC